LGSVWADPDGRIQDELNDLRSTRLFHIRGFFVVASECDRLRISALLPGADFRKLGVMEFS
jgi:hypothetical protein